MKPRNRLHAIAVGTMFFVVAASTEARSDVEEKLSLFQIARAATEIGVVRLTNARPAVFQFDGEVHSCGFVYEAEVLELLRGSGRTTTFFASYALPLNRQYLVLLFPGEPGRRLLAQSSLKLTELEKADQICRWEASPLLARDDPRSAVPFSEAATSKLGGRWLVLEDPTAWPAGKLETKTVRIGEHSIEVVEWSQVKGLLQAEE